VKLLNVKKIFFVIIIQGLLASCFAQDTKQTTADSAGIRSIKPAEPEKPAVKQEEQTKLFLDNIEVMGQLEKPQAVFFIPGTDPVIDDIQINRSFFESIFRPVEKKGIVTPNLPIEPKKENKDHIPW
jgi:hypothetical protein